MTATHLSNHILPLVICVRICVRSWTIVCSMNMYLCWDKTYRHYNSNWLRCTQQRILQNSPFVSYQVLFAFFSKFKQWAEEEKTVNKTGQLIEPQNTIAFGYRWIEFVLSSKMKSANVQHCTNSICTINCGCIAIDPIPNRTITNLNRFWSMLYRHTHLV